MLINPKLSEINLTDSVALDTEYNSLDTKHGFLHAISITNSNKETYVMERINYNHDELKELVTKLSSKEIICHNTKADIGILYSTYGVLLRNLYCTMIASQVIDNGYHDSMNMVGKISVEKPHSLYGCLRRYLGISLNDNFDKKRLQRSFVDTKPGARLTQEQLEYAGSDTHYLMDLKVAQAPYIKARELEKIVAMENRLTPVLVKIEFRGCLIDVEKHKQNIRKWVIKKDSLVKILDEIIIKLSKTHPKIYGGKFTNQRRKLSVSQIDIFGNLEEEIVNTNIHNLNYSSSVQLKDLFTRLDLPLPKDDVGKTSFGEGPLNQYLTDHPESIMSEFIGVLIEYKEYDKLLSTYGEKFLNVLDNGYLRTNYTQCFTDTGRLSSTEIVKDLIGTNLANIPKRQDVRSVFISDPGYSFVDCDMTGQEVAIATSFSKEPVLMKALKEGFDHHSYLASKSFSIIFDKEVEIVNKDVEITVGDFTYNSKSLREDHKSVLFAKFYGGGKNRIKDILSKYLANHIKPFHRLEVADKISKTIDSNLKVLSTYLRSRIDFVYKHGYIVANKLGRRRYFDNPERAYGEIMNLPIQGSGADSIKIALINIDKWFGTKSQELGIPEEELGWIVMSIYDQNLCSINDKYIELAREIQEIMAYSLTYFLDDLKGSSTMKITKCWVK